MRAVIVAIADLGRAARMRYHARALAASGVEVDLVGLEGTPMPGDMDHPRIAVHRIAPSTLRRGKGLTGVAYSGAATLDAWRLSARLWLTLRNLAPADLVIVQNPPQFPAFVVTWRALHRRGVRFVIDWHNLGYTLLQLRLGRWHPAVRLARWVERRDARRVDGHLCVSRALAAFLESRFGVRDAHVLYDRPAAAFVPVERAEREQFRQALFKRLGCRGPVVGFVVCPTSWTEDEDFDVAVDAVRMLEERIRGWEAAQPNRRFPEIVILVTGDGARRAEFERRFAGLPARRIQLRARWLEPDDYPRVVGSADLGLCLHRSSSGLDIPMKVADLFGAGVPVCALDYGACLAERVRHGDNGLLFSTARQLADVLFDLFETFPSKQPLLDRLRSGARKSARPTWEEGWAKEARPFLLREPDLVSAQKRINP
jgi:beta-1,4-mannosyltransferase